MNAIFFSEKHSAMIFTINMKNAEDSLPVTMSEEIKYAAGFVFCFCYILVYNAR